ncbi:hypothetical protein MHTCC0001_34730 [Flavobacteriaceae bacterium MHTCC 0001]
MCVPITIGIALNFASTHQAENPRGFSEVDKTKQFLLAIVAVAQDSLKIRIKLNLVYARQEKLSREVI